MKLYKYTLYNYNLDYDFQSKGINLKLNSELSKKFTCRNNIAHQINETILFHFPSCEFLFCEQGSYMSVFPYENP